MALTWEDLSARLAEPFPAAAVSWRAGSLSRDKKRAQALAYAEPRVYEDRLNDVLGPDWSCRFITWGDQRLLCELTVTVADGLGGTRDVTRTSTGEFDSGDKVAQGTAAEAQAFKRACSKFGLGRYLYDLPLTWVGYDENSRRLTETPSLPARFTAPVVRPEPRLLDPPADVKAAARANIKADVKADADTKAEPEPKREPLLSGRRADAMGRELTKLGFSGTEQRRLAERVLGHPVAGFQGLTEAEALEVWNVARRSPPRPAQSAPGAVGF